MSLSSGSEGAASHRGPDILNLPFFCTDVHYRSLVSFGQPPITWPSHDVVHLYTGMPTYYITYYYYSLYIARAGKDKGEGGGEGEPESLCLRTKNSEAEVSRQWPEA